jgi:hypothetical protein
MTQVIQQTRSAQAAPARVFDISDPDAHGIVLKTGDEVSEIQFDDGRLRHVSNQHLRQVQSPLAEDAAKDELAKPTQDPSEDAVRQGQEAWSRLRANSTWTDWIAVGAAHVIGRAAAMRDAYTNTAKGRAYNVTFSAWQKKFGFEALDKGDRSRLFEVMDHVKEIDDWLQKLPDKERLRLNHPNSVLRRWKAATAAPKAGGEPKMSPMQKIKDELVKAIEERDRYKREIERGGGDLWTANDSNKDIMRVMLGKLGKSRLVRLAQAVLKAEKTGELK